MTSMKSINKSSVIVLLAITLSIGLASMTYAQNSYSLTVGGINLDKIPGVDKFKDLFKLIPSKDVKIAFTAKVSDLQDVSNVLEDNVKVGDTLTGTYTYNPSTKDTNADETVGDYHHVKKPYGIIVNAGNLVFKTDPKNVNFLVELVNRDLDDHYLLRSYTNLPLSNGIPVEHISWQLDNETGESLSSASLKKAPTPPKLQDWIDPFGLTIIGGDESDFENSFFIRAHVDSVKLIH
jgi:hypothetical protein